MEEEILLSLSMITTPGAAAYAHEDMKYFEITSFQVNGKGNLRMYVEEAGGTSPHDTGEEKIYAYVFFTDAGLYAVTSHVGEESHQVEHDIEWHSHW